MNKRKKYRLCVECAHKHDFKIPKITGILALSYVLIDGEKFVMWHRSPSRKVRCSECGKKTHRVFEKLENKE